MDLPQQFLDNMKKILGGEYSEYEKSFSAPRLYGLRANTLKISPGIFKFHGIQLNRKRSRPSKECMPQ